MSSALAEIKVDDPYAIATLLAAGSEPPRAQLPADPPDAYLGSMSGRSKKISLIIGLNNMTSTSGHGRRSAPESLRIE